MNKNKKEEFDFVTHWANFILNNPNTWKKQHTAFINAIYEKHNAWRKRLLEKPGGKEIIAKLYGIKNKRVLDALK